MKGMLTGSIIILNERLCDIVSFDANFRLYETRAFLARIPIFTLHQRHTARVQRRRLCAGGGG